MAISKQKKLEKSYKKQRGGKAKNRKTDWKEAIIFKGVIKLSCVKLTPDYWHSNFFQSRKLC